MPLLLAQENGRKKIGKHPATEKKELTFTLTKGIAIESRWQIESHQMKTYNQIAVRNMKIDKQEKAKK
jgi:hypothetical protein